jgi:hypothetical protein
MNAHQTVRFLPEAVTNGAAIGFSLGTTYASVIVMRAGFDMHSKFPNTRMPGTTDAWFVLGGLVGMCVAFGVEFAVAKKLVSPKPTPRMP